MIQCDIEFGNYMLVASNVSFVGKEDHHFDKFARQFGIPARVIHIKHILATMFGLDMEQLLWVV